MSEQELTVLTEDNLKDIISEVLASQEPAPESDLEKNPLGGITGIEVMGVPVGRAFTGGAVAVGVGELTDMLMAPVRGQLGRWGPPAVKVVAAFVAVKYLSKFLGKDTTKTAALFLAYDAVRDIVPFDDMIRGAIPGHSKGEFGSRGMTQTTGIKNGSDYYTKVGV